IHDVALQKLPVIFCLDRAGLVGEDGATHHGVFDIAYTRSIPNIMIAAPANEIELRNLLYTAQLGLEAPLIIRYPRGRGILKEWKLPFEKVKLGKGECLSEGSELAVLSIGNMAGNVDAAINAFKSPEKVAHYDLKFVKPLDEELLQNVFNKFSKIITVEDGVKKGGFGSAILEYAASLGYKGDIEILGVPDQFIEQGSVEQLQEISGIHVEGIQEKIKSMI
ncbi:MAG TPA: transketolase C-terminal domain-containing protein, partial [Christiangramia sp.]|nr:transketolase C-terminal domain-containing protein [Christiangramia sp.]